MRHEVPVMLLHSILGKQNDFYSSKVIHYADYRKYKKL